MKSGVGSGLELPRYKAELDRTWAELQQRQATQEDIRLLGGFCQRWANSADWPKHMLPQWVTNLSRIITSFIVRSKIPFEQTIPISILEFFWEMVSVCHPATNFTDLSTTLLCILNTFDRTTIGDKAALILATSNGYIYERGHESNHKASMSNPTGFNWGVSAGKPSELKWVNEHKQLSSVQPQKPPVTEWLNDFMKHVYFLRSQDISKANFTHIHSLLAVNPETLGLAPGANLPLDNFVLSGLLTDLRLFIVGLLRAGEGLGHRRSLVTVLSDRAQLVALNELQVALLQRVYGVSSVSDAASKGDKVCKIVQQTSFERLAFALIYFFNESDIADQNELDSLLEWVLKVGENGADQLMRLLWTVVFPATTPKIDILEQIFQLAKKVLWIGDRVGELEFVDKTMLGTLTSLTKYKKSSMDRVLPTELVESALSCFGRCHQSVSRIVQNQLRGAELLQKKSSSSSFTATTADQDPLAQLSRHKSVLSNTYAVMVELAEFHPQEVLGKLQSLNPQLDSEILRLFEQEWIIHLLAKCLNNPLCTSEPPGILSGLLDFGRTAYRGGMRVRYLLALWESLPSSVGPKVEREELGELEEELLGLEELLGNTAHSWRDDVWREILLAVDQAEWSTSLDDLQAKLRFQLCRASSVVAECSLRGGSAEKMEAVMAAIQEELDKHFTFIGLPSIFSAEYVAELLDATHFCAQHKSELRQYLELFATDQPLLRLLIEVQSFAKVYHKDKLALRCNQLLVMILMHMTQKNLVSITTASKTEVTNFSPFDRTPSKTFFAVQHSGSHSRNEIPILPSTAKGLPLLLSVLGDLCVGLAENSDANLLGWLNYLCRSFNANSQKSSDASRDCFSQQNKTNTSEYMRYKVYLDIRSSERELAPGQTQAYVKLDLCEQLEGRLLSEVRANPEEFRYLLLYSRLLEIKAAEESNPFARGFFLKELVGSAACFRSTVFDGMTSLATSNNAGNGSGSAGPSPDVCPFRWLQHSQTSLRQLKLLMFVQLRHTLRTGFQLSRELGMFRVSGKLASEYLKYAEFVPNNDDLVLGLLMKSELKVLWANEPRLRQLFELELKIDVERWAKEENSAEDVIRKHQMEIRNNCHNAGITGVDNVLLLVWLTARDLMSSFNKQVLGRLIGQCMLLEHQATPTFGFYSSDTMNNNSHKLSFKVIGTHETSQRGNADLLKSMSEEIFMLVETLLETAKHNVRVVNYQNAANICRELEKGFLDKDSAVAGAFYSKKCAALKLVAAAIQSHLVKFTSSDSARENFLSSVSICLFWISVYLGQPTLAKEIFEFVVSIRNPPLEQGEELVRMALQVVNPGYRIKKHNKSVSVKLLKEGTVFSRKSMRRMTMRRADSLKEFYKYSWLLASEDHHSRLGNTQQQWIVEDPKVPMVLLGSYKNIWNSAQTEENIHIMFRSDGHRWIYSVLSKEYSASYHKLIDILVENEQMLKNSADEKTSASKWWSLRDHSERILDNQMNNIEEALGLDALLLNVEVSLSDSEASQCKNNASLRDHVLKTTLHNLTTFTEPGSRAICPRLSQLRAKYYPTPGLTRVVSGNPVAKGLKTPRKNMTPIKSKMSGPVVFTSVWDQENPSTSYYPVSLPPVAKRPLLLLLDGLQHLIPFEHLSILNEFRSTQLYRITDIAHSKADFNRQYSMICGPGFLTQRSPSARDWPLDSPRHSSPAPLGYYLINPKGDLKNTERRMKAFMAKLGSWVGKVGEEPNPREIARYLQQHLSFVYERFLQQVYRTRIW